MVKWMPVLTPGKVLQYNGSWIVLLWRKDNGWMVRWEDDPRNRAEWLSDRTVESL